MSKTIVCKAKQSFSDILTIWDDKAIVEEPETLFLFDILHTCRSTGQFCDKRVCGVPLFYFVQNGVSRSKREQIFRFCVVLKIADTTMILESGSQERASAMEFCSPGR